MSKIIEIDGLTYKYANSENDYALKDISLEIEQGSWTAIVGRNGSGKSTLARSIDGLMEFKQGSIIVDHQELSNQTVWDIRKKIGMIFQNPDNQFVGATVEDDVAFGLENLNINQATMISKVKDVLKQVRMDQFMTRQPDQLSGGQKQRVAIAGVLAVEPDIIILDEATSMLDPTGRKEILKLIDEIHIKKNITVISITHDVEEAMLADSVIVLNRGKIIQQGQPSRIFADTELIELAGLEKPFSVRLAQKLAENGINIPQNIVTNNQLLEDWLWQFLSKK